MSSGAGCEWSHPLAASNRWRSGRETESTGKGKPIFRKLRHVDSVTPDHSGYKYTLTRQIIQGERERERERAKSEREREREMADCRTAGIDRAGCPGGAGCNQGALETECTSPPAVPTMSKLYSKLTTFLMTPVFSS